MQKKLQSKKSKAWFALVGAMMLAFVLTNVASAIKAAIQINQDACGVKLIWWIDIHVEVTMNDQYGHEATETWESNLEHDVKFVAFPSNFGPDVRVMAKATFADGTSQEVSGNFKNQCGSTPTPTETTPPPSSTPEPTETPTPSPTPNNPPKPPENGTPTPGIGSPTPTGIGSPTPTDVPQPHGPKCKKCDQEKRSHDIVIPHDGGSSGFLEQLLGMIEALWASIFG